MLNYLKYFKQTFPKKVNRLHDDEIYIAIIIILISVFQAIIKHATFCILNFTQNANVSKL